MTTKSTTLIDADTLVQRLKEQPPVSVLDCRMRLDDAGAGDRLYRQGHIPGAVRADLDQRLVDRRTSMTGRHPLPDREALATAISEIGVSNSDQVVVYDDQGGAMSARLWWMLRWLGHEAVAVLDGGIQAWTAAGGELETAIPTPQPVPFVAGRPLTEPLSADGLEDGLRDGRVKLVDVRAAERFRGEHEPFDPVAGHIPGAVNRPFADNLDADGRFLPVSTLRRMYADLAKSPDQVVCMCGSGITACHTLLALEHAGVSGARLYAGSWSEWIRDPERPVATGEK